MRFFKSIQFKYMICTTLVAASSIAIIHHIYFTWFSESNRHEIENRIERALMGFDPESGAGVSDTNSHIIALRRFSLDGFIIYDVSDKKIVSMIGISHDHEYMEQMLNDARNSDSSPYVTQCTEHSGMYLGSRFFIGEDRRSYMVTVAVSNDDYIRQRKTLVAISWITFCGSLAVALLLSYLLKNMILRPVHRLSKAMVNLSSGDLYQEVDEDVDQELISLARNFNEMAKELRENREKVADYQRSLENRIQQARQQLETKESELLQATKLASVGELASGIAHEINNPIQYILLTAERLQKRATDGDTQERLANIIEQTRRCKRIVSDLLEYSRAGAMVNESFEFREILDKTLDLFAEQGLVANITFNTDISDSLPQISGSMAEIRRVLENIILNSIQATDGSGTVSISARFRQSSDMEIVISDNGPGMSKDILQKAFEPFFTTKEVGKGTGLGLSIAYGIIARHKGRISIESKVGEGTVITIILPTSQQQ